MNTRSREQELPKENFQMEEIQVEACLLASEELLNLEKKIIADYVKKGYLLKEKSIGSDIRVNVHKKAIIVISYLFAEEK